MAKHLQNPRLAKIHRSYTVEEIAILYNIHKNTVRSWIKDGLLTCDNKRPTLILGRQLREFLIRKRKKNKSTCPPGTIYCVGCKLPQKPVDNIVLYQPITDTKGMLIGTCPCDGHRIYRFISSLKLKQINLEFIVTKKTADEGLNNSC
ncbi:MAG: DNA-binding protein [Thiotrichaceae bacterium]|nr:MAG: DNA-binding protein [Thiotrichaceae bacterium]